MPHIQRYRFDASNCACRSSLKMNWSDRFPNDAREPVGPTRRLRTSLGSGHGVPLWPNFYFPDLGFCGIPMTHEKRANRPNPNWTFPGSGLILLGPLGQGRSPAFLRGGLAADPAGGSSLCALSLGPGRGAQGPSRAAGGPASFELQQFQQTSLFGQPFPKGKVVTPEASPWPSWRQEGLSMAPSGDVGAHQNR